MGKKGNGRGIQSGGSSWAKKIVVLRTQIGSVWLFYDLFVCIFYIGLMGYYMSN